MLTSKEVRLSKATFGWVLMTALYDADCSQEAREAVAAGDIGGAISK